MSGAEATNCIRVWQDRQSDHRRSAEKIRTLLGDGETEPECMQAKFIVPKIIKSIKLVNPEITVQSSNRKHEVAHDAFGIVRATEDGSR